MGAAKWKNVVCLCDAATADERLDDVLKALLTLEEQNQLTLRVELIRALLKGDKSQRQISADLGVSIATITRGSNLLKTMDPKLREFLEKTLFV